jgi:hypothetical protein
MAGPKGEGQDVRSKSPGVQEVSPHCARRNDSMFLSNSVETAGADLAANLYSIGRLSFAANNASDAYVSIIEIDLRI